MAAPTELSVRQHERHTCDAPARVVIGAASAEGVRLGSSALTRGAGKIVDFSQGGLGIRGAVFYPLTCHLRVTVLGAGGAQAEIDVRVQRASMVDRSPTYYTGTSFENPAAQADAIARVLELLRAAETPSTPKGGASA